MPDLSWLATTPTALIMLCALFGLLIGSFLNVVVQRLPVMMERAWRQEARDLLEQPQPDGGPPFNLVAPRSRCPHCQHGITWYENIPVLSWLALRGRCSQCRAPIAKRYPCTEILSAVAAALCALHFGYGGWLIFTLYASFTLLALALIDLDTRLLPDDLVYPLLWAGLLAALLGLSPVALADAVGGALAGYLLLWTLFWVFRLLTGKDGMGHGDFKLLAALGAWLGWQYLPLVLLLSSLLGLLFALLVMATGKMERSQGIPFGPWLAAAGWVTLLWGEPIVSSYLGLFRIG